MFRFRCSEIAKGDGWVRVYFVSHNDGSLPGWSVHCPTVKWEMVIDREEYLELFREGEIYEFMCFNHSEAERIVARNEAEASAEAAKEPPLFKVEEAPVVQPEAVARPSRRGQRR